MEKRVMSLLDGEGIPFKVLVHEKPAHSCKDASKERQVKLEEMIKCILLVDMDKTYVLACLPADRKLDTDKLRAASDTLHLSLAKEDEIKEVLGYSRGLIPPLCLKQDLLIVFDDSIRELRKANISSGDPHAGIELAAKELIELVHPVLADITKDV